MSHFRLGRRFHDLNPSYLTTAPNPENTRMTEYDMIVDGVSVIVYQLKSSLAEHFIMHPRLGHFVPVFKV